MIIKVRLADLLAVYVLNYGVAIQAWVSEQLIEKVEDVYVVDVTDSQK